MRLTIPTPPPFNFKRTILSHGWYDLPPFALDTRSWTLTRVLTVSGDPGGARPVKVTVTAADAAVQIEVSRRLNPKAKAKILREVRHCLRLDDDLSDFYASVAADEEFAWIARSGAGRLLRSPNVFEDLVKTICTTNCSWALTDKMANRLVEELGEAAADGSRSFPTPAAMAAVDEPFYRDKIRAGYRAPYLKELAARVVSGDLDPQSWLTSEYPTERLKREMKGVKGVGTYAAENLLRLVGRYDGLALDSWGRAKFAKMHNRGRVADDKKIERFYTRFGEWRGLALWCDMTKDWLEGEEKLW
jgi:3-methyladenine DNA glycosylase/8-oxoguanine DNA glycosylase